MGRALAGGVPPPAEETRAALVARARAEGLGPLLALAAWRSGWDPALVGLLAPERAGGVALALARRQELRRVLDGLEAARIPAMVFKGAHLEWTCYAQPGLRPREDTDLLIRPEDRAAAGAALRQLGYERPSHHRTGEVAFAQAPFGRRDERDVWHALDVHWRISDVRVFSDRLRWDDLWARRRPIAALGAGAWGPSRPDALALACIHRVAHHGCSTRLIWLHDIHVLASACGPVDWNEIIAAASRGWGGAIAGGLRLARERFGTTIPAGVLDRLDAVTDPDVAAFLRGRRAWIGVALSDWRRLSNATERARFLREHVLPPAAYMHARYGTSSRAVLPLLYASRLLRGGFRSLV